MIFVCFKLKMVVCRNNMEFWKCNRERIIGDEGFMGDPTIPPLPRFAQERIARMVRLSFIRSQTDFGLL